MKTSKKILITVAGLTIGLLVTALSLLRGDMKELAEQLQSGSNFQRVIVETFNRLQFQGNWEVHIRQGRQQKVEIDPADDWSIETALIQKDSTLYFASDTTSGKPNNKSFAKITTPDLEEILAGHGVHIEMRSFKADSLFIKLEHKSSFTGNENTLENVYFITSGESWLQLIDDPMK